MIPFYILAAIAIFSTLEVVLQLNAVHALLYLVVSLLSVALTFYLLGAPFAAALEIITYAGAIMVLFIFVAILLNLGPTSTRQEREWLNPRAGFGPAGLGVMLLFELIWIFAHAKGVALPRKIIGPHRVGRTLLGPYLLGVELSSFLLLSGLIGAFHIGRDIERDRVTDKKGG